MLICWGLVLGLCAPAFAAGGPVSPVQGGAGVSAPGGPDNLIAVQAGADTLVLRVSRASASVRRTRLIPGSFGVPGATYDGVNTGLAADGRTLVLAGGVNRHTTLQQVDARTLRPLRRIALDGLFTVDAISPDGRWLYLIDYKDINAADYDVRAYDLQRGRMAAGTIIDPRDPEEKLHGAPVTRVQSPDGRWAYTLYSGEQPFIHALDTVGRTAVCIDLPAAIANDIGLGRLALHGSTLTVSEKGQPQAVVDLTSFKVHRPSAAAVAVATSAPARASATPSPAPADDGGPSWALWAIPLAAVAALAVLARRRVSGSRIWSRS